MNVSAIKGKLAITTLLLGSALLTGCGKAKEPWEVVYPAKGIVKYDGKPLDRAVITLIPQDPDIPETLRPTASTKEDGTFEVGTYSKSDGAPEGKYKVIVLHYPIIGKKESPASGPNDLPRKYSKPETTDLIVEVAGPTEFKPFELTRR